MILQAEIYESNSTTYTKSVYQHDKNVTLVFEGIDLPVKYEVHFSNQKDSGISVSREGTESGVPIPDELLSTGEYVYAWVCDADESTGVNVSFTVVIPVIPRPISIPVGSGGSDIPIITGYEVNPEEENLSFTGYMNKILNDSKEEET